MRRIPTKAELQKQNQKRKEALIKKAQEKGIVELSARYLSAIYLLHSHSAVLYADLEEILQENGLEIGKAKWYGKKLNMAFDKYFESLSRMIGRDQTEAWANDLEQFGKQFNQFAGLPTQERDTNNGNISGSAECPYCSGDGWTAEHDSHPHPDGDCMGMCPIQVQCPHCEATGKVMQEVVDKYNEDVKVSEKESDLPF